jgi:hypothetical protein
MIVVEGADGTGKTTLVNQLAQDFNLNVGMRGTHDRDKLFEVTRQDTYTALAHAVRGREHPKIWDRLGPFSDPIYSQVMKRRCAFKTTELDFARSIFKALQCPIIFCIVPFEVLQENCLNGGHQMEGVLDNLLYIASAYVSMKDSIDWAIEYDYRDPSAYDRLVEQTIRPFLARRKDREWHS